jgi:hypothetical protein
MSALLEFECPAATRSTLIADSLFRIYVRLVDAAFIAARPSRPNR